RRLPAAARWRSGPRSKSLKSAFGPEASIFGGPRLVAANCPAPSALRRTVERRKRCEGPGLLEPVSPPRIGRRAPIHESLRALSAPPLRRRRNRAQRGGGVRPAAPSPVVWLLPTA